MPGRKSERFTLPGTAKAPPTKPRPKPPDITMGLFNHESGYVLGALKDAETKALTMQAHCEASGSTDQARVFAQKAKTLSEIAERMTKAFKERTPNHS